MSEPVRDFHFNVNVRASGGSKAAMANNENSFLRAMEIQERKREKKELERLEAEKKAVAEAPPTEVVETVQCPEEVPAVIENPEVSNTDTSADPVPVSQPKPIELAVKPKPTGGGVPGPTPRSDFTAEERAAMLKRARAHAAEVKARKEK